MRLLFLAFLLAINYAQTESKVGFGGSSGWTVFNPGAFLERIGEMFEPREDNGGCHANMIPYDGYCYGTMDYLTESASQNTKGKDQSGRFMSVPTDCEVAPPDSAVVQNVVMMSPFATNLVVFKDGAGFGTSMSAHPFLVGFGPGLRYQGSALPSLISEKGTGSGTQYATAIGHAKVFLRCTSPEAVVDSLDIPHFPTREEENKPLMVYCGVNKCEYYNSCYTAIKELEEDKDWNDLKECPSGYSMMGSRSEEKSYCRDPGTVQFFELTLVPDWLVVDQWLRVCMRSSAESKVGGSDCNSPPKSKCELCEGYMACDGKEYVITSYQLVDDAKPHPLFGCTYPKTYTYVDLCPEDGAASSEVAVSQVNAPSKTLDKPKKTVNYGPEYAGCFEYVKSDTLLIGEDTPLNCLKKCSDGGSAYFGLVSNTCFCVKEKIDESTIKSSDGCTTSADGLPIGGGNAISVYTTAQTYDSITCDELCASGEAGSLCTCDTQPPAKSATTGPEALSILEQNESVIKVFAFIGCVSLVYYGLKCSCMKAKQYYEEVEGHEEI